MATIISPFRFLINASRNGCGLFLSVLVGACSFSALSADEKMPASYHQCIACHGDQGQGNEALNSPAIAGQFDWYLKRQLVNFKSGVRGAHPDDSDGSQMAAIASLLNDQDVPELASYLASLSETKVKQSEGDIRNGQSYYQAKCGGCHGGQAEGNKSFNAPKLTGLGEKYLKGQMAKFTNGIRGTKQEDKLGRQMAMMAKITPAKEVNDIIVYITAMSAQADAK